MTLIENIKNRIEVLKHEINEMDNQIIIKNSIKNELENIIKNYETSNKYIDLWRVGKKIETIKQYRQDTGASLNEAINACDRMAREVGLPGIKNCSNS